MKQYWAGLGTGMLGFILAVMLMGAQQLPSDSIQIYLERLQNLMETEIQKNRENGRFQLQSFDVDRTHWHYLLDTATGRLYRLQPSRTAANSKWVLVSEPNFETISEF